MLLLFLAVQAPSPANPLLALDRRIQTAMVANEQSVLRQSISEDFRFTHNDGSVERRSDVLHSAALTPRYYLRRKVLKATAEIYGNFGLVFGTLDVATGATAQDEPGTKPVCYALNYVHVYKRRHGRWLFLSHRTTEMTQPEHPCADAG